MTRRNHEILRGLKVGDTITADFLSRLAMAINRNAQAVAAPRRPSVAPRLVIFIMVVLFSPGSENVAGLCMADRH